MLKNLREMIISPKTQPAVDEVFVCEKHGTISIDRYIYFSGFSNEEINGYYCLECVGEFMKNNFPKMTKVKKTP